MSQKKLIKDLVNEMEYLSKKGVPDEVIQEAFKEAINEFDLGDITKLGSDAFSTLKNVGGGLLDLGKSGVEGISNIDIAGGLKNVKDFTGKGKDIAKSIGIGVSETLKKRLAKYVLSQLNVSPDTFLGLVLTNFFANLSFNDYKKVFKDCDFTCSLLSESLVDALIDQMRIKFNFDSISWSIVQDTIMDRLKQTDTIQSISAKLNGYICPHLADAREMIIKKTPWVSTFI
jgi:hypothetical protein